MSKLTMLSFGGGQDSTAILYKLIYDEKFRAKYAPEDLIVVMADTGNEHPETNTHVGRVSTLCQFNNIPFVLITGDMGFTSDSWSKGLVHFYKTKKAVGSKAFPKTCTDKLKITPIYNWLEQYIHLSYGTEAFGRKGAIKEFAAEHGKIDVLIGIAREEESRAGRNDESPQKWMRDSINKVYPLIDMGWNRQDCQNYIGLELKQEIPLPSNCILCPFMSLQELLYMYRVMPHWYDIWVELEQSKINNNLHAGDRNLGVWGKKLLPEALKDAEKKHGHMTNEELFEYKMSHGHCVKSKY